MLTLKRLLPFLFLLALFGLLTRELFYSNRNNMPSPLVGDLVPSFNLPNIIDSDSFTPNDLPKRVSLINVWATWCSACSMEHSMLLKITREYHVPVFGIAYKDNVGDVRNWLSNKGNPYTKVGDDSHGNAAIDFGVFGTPETFLISPQGKIIYRHIGAIDQHAWEEEFLPLIKQYGQFGLRT